MEKRGKRGEERGELHQKRGEEKRGNGSMEKRGITKGMELRLDPCAEHFRMEMHIENHRFWRGGEIMEGHTKSQYSVTTN